MTSSAPSSTHTPSDSLSRPPSTAPVTSSRRKSGLPPDTVQSACSAPADTGPRSTWCSRVATEGRGRSARSSRCTPPRRDSATSTSGRRRARALRGDHEHDALRHSRASSVHDTASRRSTSSTCTTIRRRRRGRARASTTRSRTAAGSPCSAEGGSSGPRVESGTVAADAVAVDVRDRDSRRARRRRAPPARGATCRCRRRRRGARRARRRSVERRDDALEVAGAPDEGPVQPRRGAHPWPPRSPRLRSVDQRRATRACAPVRHRRTTPARLTAGPGVRPRRARAPRPARPAGRRRDRGRRPRPPGRPPRSGW